MAVYTEVGDDALEAFLADYNVGSVLSYKGIAEGVENTNYLVTTDADRFILTLYEKRVAKDDLPFFLALMDHLANRDVPCPTPVQDRTGQRLGTLCGRPAALIRYLDGVWVRRPSPAHCRELGRALATLHQAGTGFDMMRANALGPDAWPQLAASCGSGADTLEPGLGGEIATEIADLETLWPDDLPHGVIHADLFPDNVFFIRSELSGLIDFYFACTDALAYDIAICLNAWCFEPDGAFNITKSRALLNAYQSVRPLAAGERVAMPVLARGAALRFLLTRLFDWINTPADAFVKPKDPMEYAHRMRFHRKVKAPSEYGFNGSASGSSE